MEMKTVSVYGYGRFGRLWARILSRDFNVKVYSRRGLTPDGVDSGLEIADATGIFQCDALFFCVAISAFRDVLQKAGPFLKPGTVIFDTCSVKVLPAAWMKELVPAGCPIIATHPMFGPDSYGRMEREPPMVMCDVTAGKDLFDHWSAYFASRSLQIEVMTPEEHDETMAYSQGITHYVGRVLGDLSLKAAPTDTHGYRLLMKIVQQTCNDSFQLFVDLLRFNPYSKPMLERLALSLDKVNQTLENTGEIAD